MKKIAVALILMVSLILGCVEKPASGINKTVNNRSDEGSFAADLAKKDLAGRLNITEEKIELITLERVDWPDTSLGYPEEGKMYAQVITPGFRIILKANESLYEYHSDYRRVVGPPNT